MKSHTHTHTHTQTHTLFLLSTHQINTYLTVGRGDPVIAVKKLERGEDSAAIGLMGAGVVTGGSVGAHHAPAFCNKTAGTVMVGDI
jgi:hypothetical protein